MQCNAAEHLTIARSWARGFIIGAHDTAGGTPTATNPDGRLRIGYIFGEFRNNSIAGLVADLVEHHDRQRIEIYGYSWSHDDGSDVRQRLIGAFDNFVDLRTFSNIDSARQIRDDAIDVLIDLNGYNQDARPLILANRPAPVQVSFLAYPGTMGAPFMDYIIADPLVLPMDQQPHYDEKI
ncbi:MAG: hypothetical protein P8Y36_04065, partial [Alphaproteobacteria bacterium]